MQTHEVDLNEYEHFSKANIDPNWIDLCVNSPQKHDYYANIFSRNIIWCLWFTYESVHNKWGFATYSSES